MMVSRRKIMTACASLIGTCVLRKREWTAKAEEKAPVYKVDLSELVKAFPGQPGSAALPPLLRRFGEWMSGKPWRSIGAFDLSVQWSDNHFPGGEIFYDSFALFIRLPDGSSVGYWLADHDLAHAPIVLLGSEGEFATIAPNLETLLARIALGDFGPKSATADFLYSDEDYGDGAAPDLRGAMQTFLRKETGLQDLDSLARKARPAPSDFTQWVATYFETYAAQMQAHPAIQAMASHLAKYRPVNAQPWDGVLINVIWVGEYFDAWAMLGGPKTLAETEALKPYLAILRDDAAAKKPGLGLWHRATLMVYADHLQFSANYLFEPEFRSDRPPAAAFKADQARAPRESRRIPPWLAAILTP
jgi:hypothetical protein